MWACRWLYRPTKIFEPGSVAGDNNRMTDCINHRWRLLPAGLVLLVLLGACSSVSYLGQAAAGQLLLWWHRQPIADLLEDTDTAPELKSRLQHVIAVRNFASRELSLPQNDSYRTFVDLDRPYVVWNVFAAAEFSVEPREWCFPMVGCVAYRGYFSEQRARQFAQQLQAQSLDTYVAGVPAYSTLGWFDDPIPSTVIGYSELQLAGLIFHELAHQQLFVPGDTAFNESFATAVEIEGMRRWLQAQGRVAELQQFVSAIERRKDFVSTVLTLRRELEQLYAQPLADREKRVRKQALFEAFRRDQYTAFRQRWEGTREYDGWIQQDFNNARLVTVSSYYLWLDCFQRWIESVDHDMASFYRQVAPVSRLEKSARDRYLATKFEK